MTRPAQAKGLRQVAPTYVYIAGDVDHNDLIDQIVAGRMAKGDHVHVRGTQEGVLCMNPEDTRCRFDGTDPGSDPVKDRVKYKGEK